MAVTHSAAARNDMADAVAALANGSTQTVLVIGTSSLATSGSTGVLCSINIPDFTVSAEVATSAANTNSGTATATGTAAIAAVRDGSGNEVFRGSCGTSGTDVTISSTSIVTNDTVTLTSNVTWTAPL